MESSIYYLLVCLGSALFSIGIVTFLKKPFFQLSISAVKQLDVILNSSLEENKKDQLILKNLFQLVLHLVTTIFILIVTMAIGISPAFFYVKQYSNEQIDFSSLNFYLSLILGSAILLFFKKKSSDYSYWSKLLHTIILDNYNIGKFLFRKECKKKNLNIKQENHIFIVVTGLARAGTTALTNLLFDPNIFHSINYSNMPFLMTPNLWKKVYRSEERRVGKEC